MWFEGEGRLRVWCTMMKVGDGLVFCVGGGEEHVGAVSIAVPYRRKDGGWSVSTSTITLPAHRDDVLTKIIAENIARATGKVVVAVGGVHVDAASKEEIEKIVSNVEKLTEKVLAELKGSVATDSFK